LQKGFKAAVYDLKAKESRRMTIASGFLKNQIDVLVAPSGEWGCLDELRNAIKVLIHFTLPRSIAAYLNDVAGLPSEAVQFVLFNNEDFYSIRNGLALSILPFNKVSAVVSRLLLDFEH